MFWIALQPAPEACGPTGALQDGHTALAWWALQFTPLVARVQDALVLEVSASARLFGGRAALVREIYTQNKPIAPVECAWGATSLIALGRLWSQMPRQPVDALPLHTLAAARPHLPTLARLGCRTWGDVRALPRGGLVRRFGAELVAALDRAYGLAPEVYPWLAMPDVFDAPLELSASVESAAAMLFGARRLLAQLQLWLQLRQQGVLVLELRWELDARRSNALYRDAHHHGDGWGQLVLRTAEATQDMAHLQRLLGEQLAHVHLPAPVLHLRLRTVQIQALAGESLSLLPEDARQGDSLHQLLERLSARLGAQQVVGLTPQADHRPERMQRWSAAVDLPPAGRKASAQFAMVSGAAHACFTGATGQKSLKNTWTSELYPSWLLTPPQRLAVQQDAPQYYGALALMAGPQRLEAGWLDGDGDSALRDYYVARSAVAGLVWVYRERLPAADNPAPRWYLHGLFA
jgi:protein ImuB